MQVTQLHLHFDFGFVTLSLQFVLSDKDVAVERTDEEAQLAIGHSLLIMDLDRPLSLLDLILDGL